MFIACEKEDGGMQQANKIVTIGVNQEQVTDAASRVAIVENGEKFSLNWEGTESLVVSTSTNSSYKTFSQTEAEGTSAQFTGELPNEGTDIETTNYFVAVSSFVSRATSNGNVMRVAISENQTYNDANPASIASSCALVGKVADCIVGEIGDNISLKTMNAFIKIPVTMGVAASGSTNTYNNGMKLQSVKIEAPGGEQLAGRFAIALDDENWMNAYGEDAGLANYKSNSVTLNCGELSLSNAATNLYFAVAFGTYTQGLKVTFTVVGDDKKVGVMEKTIQAASGCTLARNTLLSLPVIAVSPSDVAVETYEIIDSIDKLTAGTYYMAAKANGSYYLATGALTTTTNKDLVTTSAVTYSDSSQTIDITGAAEIVIETKDATLNQYYIKINDQYLTSTELKNRRMALQDPSDDNPFWTATNDTARGGIILGCSAYQVYLITASASSNYLRTYTSSSGGTDKGAGGVYFIKKN